MRKVCQVFGSEAGGEGFAKIDRESAECDERLGCGRFEDALHFGSDFGALLVAVHAERAGELVGDVEGFEAGVFLERAGAGGRAELVQELKTLANGREVFLPELGDDVVDLAVALVGGGFLHRLWCG